MLPDVTPVHKGLAPSGNSFLKELYLPFKAHTTASSYSGSLLFEYNCFLTTLGQSRRAKWYQSATAWSLERYSRF